VRMMLVSHNRTVGDRELMSIGRRAFC
jgi:hypothetical protein